MFANVYVYFILSGRGKYETIGRGKKFLGEIWKIIVLEDFEKELAFLRLRAERFRLHTELDHI